MSNSTTGLRLKDVTKKRLETLGKTRDRSTSYLMNEAIERFLDQEEALETEKKIMHDRWERFKLTGETISHSEVKKWVENLKTKSA